MNYLDKESFGILQTLKKQQAIENDEGSTPMVPIKKSEDVSPT